MVLVNFISAIVVFVPLSKSTQYFALSQLIFRCSIFKVHIEHGSSSSEELVGTSGLEPPTSRLSGARSNHLSYAPMSGGDEEVRTPDPLRARQVLSQLSYTPIFFEGCALKIEQHPLPESLH